MNNNSNMNRSFISTFPPEVYYGNQAKATNFYLTYQGGRGIGSLFKAAKNIAIPFMKNVLLPVIKDEASQLLNDVASGKSLKNSLKSSAKRIGKRVITKVLTGRGRRKVIHSKRRNTTKRSIKAKPVTKCKRSQAKRTSRLTPRGRGRRRRTRTKADLRKMLLMRLAQKGIKRPRI